MKDLFIVPKDDHFVVLRIITMFTPDTHWHIEAAYVAEFPFHSQALEFILNQEGVDQNLSKPTCG